MLNSRFSPTNNGRGGLFNARTLGFLALILLMLIAAWYGNSGGKNEGQTSAVKMRVETPPPVIIVEEVQIDETTSSLDNNNDNDDDDCAPPRPSTSVPLDELLSSYAAWHRSVTSYRRKHTHAETLAHFDAIAAIEADNEMAARTGRPATSPLPTPPRELRFMLMRSWGGLGNRLLPATGALLLALQTRRIILVSWKANGYQTQISDIFATSQQSLPSVMESLRLDWDLADWPEIERLDGAEDKSIGERVCWRQESPEQRKSISNFVRNELHLYTSGNTPANTTTFVRTTLEKVRSNTASGFISAPPPLLYSSNPSVQSARVFDVHLNQYWIPLLLHNSQIRALAQILMGLENDPLAFESWRTHAVVGVNTLAASSSAMTKLPPVSSIASHLWPLLFQPSNAVVERENANRATLLKLWRPTLPPPFGTSTSSSSSAASSPLIIPLTVGIQLRHFTGMRTLSSEVKGAWFSFAAIVGEQLRARAMLILKKYSHLLTEAQREAKVEIYYHLATDDTTGSSIRVCREKLGERCASLVSLESGNTENELVEHVREANHLSGVSEMRLLAEHNALVLTTSSTYGYAAQVTAEELREEWRRQQKEVEKTQQDSDTSNTALPPSTPLFTRVMYSSLPLVVRSALASITMPPSVVHLGRADDPSRRGQYTQQSQLIQPEVDWKWAGAVGSIEEDQQRSRALFVEHQRRYDDKLTCTEDVPAPLAASLDSLVPRFVDDTVGGRATLARRHTEPCFQSYDAFFDNPPPDGLQYDLSLC